MKLLLAAALLLLAGSPALARPADDDPSRARFERTRLVRVKPGERAVFYNIGDARLPCPALLTGCRSRAYVLPGDLLVTAESEHGFALVDFVGPSGIASNGAIELRLLQTVTPTPLKLNDWLGLWRDGGEKSITIKPDGLPGTIRIEGLATFGLYDPYRVRQGHNQGPGVNDGEFAGTVRPTGEWAGVIDGEDSPMGRKRAKPDRDWAHDFPYKRGDDGGCQVRLRLLGPYLLAYDDGNNCGGLNINFSGTYRRVASHRR